MHGDELRPSDVPLSAFDFHCCRVLESVLSQPMVKQQLRRVLSRHAAYAEVLSRGGGGGVDGAAEVGSGANVELLSLAKEAMWSCSSGLSVKWRWRPGALVAAMRGGGRSGGGGGGRGGCCNGGGRGGGGGGRGGGDGCAAAGLADESGYGLCSVGVQVPSAGQRCGACTVRQAEISAVIACRRAEAAAAAAQLDRASVSGSRAEMLSVWVAAAEAEAEAGRQRAMAAGATAQRSALLAEAWE
eukprot:4966992-Pleurochrysis_carterae.AAC.1